MGLEAVRAYLKKFNLDSKIQEFAVSSATVELAAAALQVEPARIAKSLALHGSDGAIMIVTAGDSRIDNKLYKIQFGVRARMLSREETRMETGYDVGSVCPFALENKTPVYLDESLRRFDKIFPAAGSENSAVELSCQELEQCACNFSGWVDVCKNWRG